MGRELPAAAGRKRAWPEAVGLEMYLRVRFYTRTPTCSPVLQLLLREHIARAALRASENILHKKKRMIPTEKPNREGDGYLGWVSLDTASFLKRDENEKSSSFMCLY